LPNGHIGKLMAKNERHSEIADRTLSERDKIAELELENSQLRQLVTDLLGWDERENRRCKEAVNAPKKLPRRGRRSGADAAGERGGGEG
jgi:hypothetical protein